VCSTLDGYVVARDGLSVGDALVPSGRHDGVAVAEAVGASERPIVAIAMSSCTAAMDSWRWVDGAVVPPSVGAALGASLGGAMRQRDAQIADLAQRLQRLEAEQRE
jgi:hypothetical protein